MKRWQVVATYSSPLLFAATSESVVSEHRWRWAALLSAWTWNIGPHLIVHSVAWVRRKPVELRVVK